MSAQTLGLPPVLSIIMVSERAWSRIDQVKYYGYDSKHWRPGLSDLYKSLVTLLSENNHIERHALAKDYVIKRGTALGLELFVSSPANSSPTGTVFKVPKGICGAEFRRAMLSRFGIDVGDNLEHIGDRIFRIAHMGFEETDLKSLQRAMNAIEWALNDLQNNNTKK